MDLQDLWFCLIALLWTGYLVLEGFDFGVGMLLPFVPRDEKERGIFFSSIGPFWDGNEVWLVVAGGATFAAFPAWYGTMFSGFYLALLLVLFFLIIRVVSFEWREKSESPRWRRFWLWCNAVGSAGVALIWGIGLSNLLYGVPINSSGDFTGNLASLFNVYTIFGGLTFVFLFAFHGAVYLTLRTTGGLCERVMRTAKMLAVPGMVIAVAYVFWTVAVAVDRNDKDVFPPILPAALTLVALALAVLFVRRGQSGRAFSMTALGTLGLVVTLFTSLYPRVMVSSTDFSNSLTISNASSAHYTLQVMSVAALIFLPLVLIYQGWTYYVFRARVTGEEPPSPTEALPERSGGSPAG